MQNLKKVKSASRVLDIVELLTKNRQGLTLSEISTELQIPVSSTHGLIMTLLKRGYVERNGSKKEFQLGLRVLELGSVYLRNIDVVEEAKPVMKELIQRCNETVNLAILKETDIIYVAKEEGSQPMRLFSYVGKRIPAHATALGKILLSQYTDQDIDALYANSILDALTPNTICNLFQLKKELAGVRLNGYAYDDEESTRGLKCFGAAIFDHEGKITAALSVSVPSVRLDEQRKKEIIAVVQDAGERVSRRMGWKKVE